MVLKSVLPALAGAAFVVLYVVATSNIPWRKFNIASTSRKVQQAYRDRRFLCENLLTNISDGEWIRKKYFVLRNSTEYEILLKQERELDLHLSEYRIRRGIHTGLWRRDLRCGFRNYKAKPAGSTYGGPTGAWCDANSSKPCCSDEGNGTCGKKCDCPRCVDMRKIFHAEISNWIPRDKRCKVKNYTAEAACDIIRRFSEIHFTGNSFVRKLGRGFILTLRSDPNFGGLTNFYDEEKIKLCVGLDQFYWAECNYGFMTNSSNLQDDRPLCGMEVGKFSVRNAWDRFKEANDLVKQLAGKEGSVVFVGIGPHYSCNSSVVYEGFILPSVKYRDEYYESKNMTNSRPKWPHIVFLPPDTPGILKSHTYDWKNGRDLCNKYTDEMIEHCKMHGVSVLDVRKVTSGVHSYDGSHYGLGVNLMKTQLILNFLDSISIKRN